MADLAVLRVAAFLAAVVLLRITTIAAEEAIVTYYATVENRLPAASGMELTCLALAGASPDYSDVPRGRIARGTRRGMELAVYGDEPGRARCSWAYEGNFVAGAPLFDSQWPEARGCLDPARKCRVMFEDDRVYIEAADGTGRRVLGDLPVKRCRRHWLLFSTGCSYPEHEHPYIGRVLSNSLEYFVS